MDRIGNECTALHAKGLGPAAVLPGFRAAVPGLRSFPSFRLWSRSRRSSKRPRTGKERHDAGSGRGCVEDQGERGLPVSCRVIRSHTNTHEHQSSIQTPQLPAMVCPLHRRFHGTPVPHSPAPTSAPRTDLELMESWVPMPPR